jgi:hypothetical protein
MNSCGGRGSRGHTSARGRSATMSKTPGLVTMNSHAARLLATEVLLADPEALEDDVLESCLYIFRDKLMGAAGEAK